MSGIVKLTLGSKAEVPRPNESYREGSTSMPYSSSCIRVTTASASASPVPFRRVSLELESARYWAPGPGRLFTMTGGFIKVDTVVFACTAEGTCVDGLGTSMLVARFLKCGGTYALGETTTFDVDLPAGEVTTSGRAETGVAGAFDGNETGVAGRASRG
jgi:hypothetical protein